MDRLYGRMKTIMSRFYEETEYTYLFDTNLKFDFDYILSNYRILKDLQ